MSAGKILSALVLATIATGTQAAPLTNQQIFEQFNLVVFNNSNSSSHVDGRSFIGGNLSGGDYVQHPDAVAPSNYTGLTILGNASGNIHVNGLGAVVAGNASNLTVNTGNAVVFGNVNNSSFNGSGSYYVGGSAHNSNLNTQRDASLATGAAVTASTSTNFQSQLSGLSTKLSTLHDTGSSVVFSGNKVTFQAVANAQGLAVFDLTGIDTRVFSASEFQFNLNGARTVIFNSDETSANISANFLGGSARTVAPNTIWNFYNASSLNLNSEFGGSILAPLATLKNSNNIEGNVYVSELVQRGEIHATAFTGTVPAVPEPESYALILAGLGLLGFMQRRRQR